MSGKANAEAVEFLRRIGEAGDGPHDIARAALMLASLDQPATPLASYDEHLADIARLSRDGTRGAMPLTDAARILSEVMAGHFGYAGDRASYDDPKNADLMSVIGRRRGLPVTLGILYIHAARAAGLIASGLNTPGHFLLSLGPGGDLWLDPFNGGAAMARSQIGMLPGNRAAANLAESVSDTDVLLRLQNNLKLRALDAGEGTRALEIANRMALFAPGRADVWFDLARLAESAGILGSARRAYEACLNIAKPGQNLHNETVLALAALKRKLN